MPKKESAKEKAANKAAAAAEAAGVLLCARESPLAWAAGRCAVKICGASHSHRSATDAPGERRHTHALRLLERRRWPWWRGPAMLGSAAGRMHATTNASPWRGSVLGGLTLRLCRCSARACCCCRQMPLLLPGLNRAAAVGCKAVGFDADALAAGAGPLMREAS